MKRAGARSGRSGGGACGENAASLPVKQADFGAIRIRVDYENAFGAECAVDNPMAVGVANGIGDLAREAQADVQSEGSAALA